MGLIIALICIGGGAVLLAPLTVPLLRYVNDKVVHEVGDKHEGADGIAGEHPAS